MGISWFDRVRKFKSPLHVVAAFLLRSRDTKDRHCEELKRQVEELRLQQQSHCKTYLRIARERDELKQQVCRLESEKEELANRGIVLPPDPPVETHGYGPRMVSLSANLAKRLGFRGAEFALQTVFEWLEVSQKVPCPTSIRLWLQRLGVAAVTAPIKKSNDLIWLADHSNQIGTEKILVVLGVPASQLPAPGETLKHEDVRVLMVKPGTSWKKEDMAAAYTELEQRVGTPRAVIADGAAELHDGAECLKTRRADMIVLRDFKHYAANLFKAMLGKCERFAEFNKLVGQTRCAIQQTELAHLVPPSIRQKSRFMNLKAVLEWADCMLWLLEHPKAESCGMFTAERLEKKLGWLKSFCNEIALWNEYQQVISRGLALINTQGLVSGIADRLRTTITADLKFDTSRDLAEQLVQFVRDAEAKLKPGERLWLSTEILESTFSLYKQLERQQSKGGFTSLIAAFGGLLNKATPETVQEAFSRVAVKDVTLWVKENLGQTLNSKKRTTYNEFRKNGATA